LPLFFGAPDSVGRCYTK